MRSFFLLLYSSYLSTFFFVCLYTWQNRMILTLYIHIIVSCYIILKKIFFLVIIGCYVPLCRWEWWWWWWLKEDTLSIEILFSFISSIVPLSSSGFFFLYFFRWKRKRNKTSSEVKWRRSCFENISSFLKTSIVWRKKFLHSSA